MRKANTFIKSILLFVITSVTSCIPSFNLKVKNFSDEQLKWFRPYTKTDTVIFVSQRQEADTIIFYKTQSKKDTVNNPLERGHYITNYLSVPYKFTKGSYHQFALMSDGKNRYDQDVFNLSKNSDDYVQFEITFIGTIFNGKELNHIDKLTQNSFYFNSKKATYSGMDVEKEINDFTFDTRIGIVKYTDNRNVQWLRLKK